jgi:hypothetical protein
MLLCSFVILILKKDLWNINAMSFIMELCYGSLFINTYLKWQDKIKDAAVVAFFI